MFKSGPAKYKVPFIINDNVEIAGKIQADGVHLGQQDMDPLKARKLLGEDKIIGVSCRTVEAAKKAEDWGRRLSGSGEAAFLLLPKMMQSLLQEKP